MDDFSTAEIVVLVIVFLIKRIIAPMSSFWLSFGLGFFVSDGGGIYILGIHSTQDYRAEQSSLSALPQHIQTSTPSC